MQLPSPKSTSIISLPQFSLTFDFHILNTPIDTDDKLLDKNQSSNSIAKDMLFSFADGGSSTDNGRTQDNYVNDSSCKPLSAPKVITKLTPISLFGSNSSQSPATTSFYRVEPDINSSTIFAVTSILKDCTHINSSPQNKSVSGVIENSR